MHDERGSVVSIRGGGAAVLVNAYDEFGTPAAANTGRFQYTGQMWLAEAGVYRYKARAYLPALGRFAQIDPIGFAGGMNLYAYVGNDPINFTDPLGLQEQGETPGDCRWPRICVTGHGSAWGRVYTPADAAVLLSLISGGGGGFIGDVVTEEEIVVTAQKRPPQPPQSIRVQHRVYPPSGTSICEQAYLACMVNRQAWYDLHVGDTPANDNAPLDAPTGLPSRSTEIK